MCFIFKIKILEMANNFLVKQFHNKYIYKAKPIYE